MSERFPDRCNALADLGLVGNLFMLLGFMLGGKYVVNPQLAASAWLIRKDEVAGDEAVKISLVTLEILCYHSISARIHLYELMQKPEFLDTKVVSVASRILNDLLGDDQAQKGNLDSNG